MHSSCTPDLSTEKTIQSAEKLAPACTEHHLKRKKIQRTAVSKTSKIGFRRKKTDNLFQGK